MPVIVAAEPARAMAWRAWMEPGEEVRPAHTLNQLLALLSRAQGGQTEVWLDPAWVEPGWWPGILALAAIVAVPIWVAVETARGWEWWEMRRDEPERYRPAPSGGCVERVPGQPLRHRGQPLALSPRLTALLEVLSQGQPGHAWTLPAINQALAARGLPPLSRQALKVHIHALRDRLGPEHLKTLPRYGYQWQPCGDRREGAPGGPAVECGAVGGGRATCGPSPPRSGVLRR
ncbi:MAG: helix-turn-helix domain-containing protein [Firmicutes bacterium]|nr:helix-turn-helix domain-containing protein [Alicyclobacillaceae bacterium]MCL6496239.1 helix-turn-helix domain-containing protein [Bacillota bacterium]